MSMNVGSWVLCASVCLVGCLYITYGMNANDVFCEGVPCN